MLEDTHHRRNQHLGHRPEDGSLIGFHPRIVFKHDLAPVQDNHAHAGRQIAVKEVGKPYLSIWCIHLVVGDLRHRIALELPDRSGAVHIDRRKDAVEVLVIPGHVLAIDGPPRGVLRQFLDLVTNLVDGCSRLEPLEFIGNEIRPRAWSLLSRRAPRHQ